MDQFASRIPLNSEVYRRHVKAKRKIRLARIESLHWGKQALILSKQGLPDQEVAEIVDLDLATVSGYLDTHL